MSDAFSPSPLPEDRMMWNFVASRIRRDDGKLCVFREGHSLWHDFKRQYRTQKSAQFYAQRFELYLVPNLEHAPFGDHQKLDLFWALGLPITRQFLDKVAIPHGVECDADWFVTGYSNMGDHEPWEAVWPPPGAPGTPENAPESSEDVPESPEDVPPKTRRKSTWKARKKAKNEPEDVDIELEGPEDVPENPEDVQMRNEEMWRFLSSKIRIPANAGEPQRVTVCPDTWNGFQGSASIMEYHEYYLRHLAPGIHLMKFPREMEMELYWALGIVVNKEHLRILKKEYDVTMDRKGTILVYSRKSPSEDVQKAGNSKKSAIFEPPTLKKPKIEVEEYGGNHQNSGGIQKPQNLQNLEKQRPEFDVVDHDYGIHHRPLFFSSSRHLERIQNAQNLQNAEEVEEIDSDGNSNGHFDVKIEDDFDDVNSEKNPLPARHLTRVNPNFGQIGLPTSNAPESSRDFDVNCGVNSHEAYQNPHFPRHLEPIFDVVDHDYGIRHRPPIWTTSSRHLNLEKEHLERQNPENPEGIEEINDDVDFDVNLDQKNRPEDSLNAPESSSRHQMNQDEMNDDDNFESFPTSLRHLEPNESRQSAETHNPSSRHLLTEQRRLEIRGEIEKWAEGGKYERQNPPPWLARHLNYDYFGREKTKKKTTSRHLEKNDLESGAPPPPAPAPPPRRQRLQNLQNVKNLEVKKEIVDDMDYYHNDQSPGLQNPQILTMPKEEEKVRQTMGGLLHQNQNPPPRLLQKTSSNNVRGKIAKSVTDEMWSFLRAKVRQPDTGELIRLKVCGELWREFVAMHALKKTPEAFQKHYEEKMASSLHEAPFNDIMKIELYWSLGVKVNRAFFEGMDHKYNFHFTTADTLESFKSKSEEQRDEWWPNSSLIWSFVLEMSKNACGKLMPRICDLQSDTFWRFFNDKFKMNKNPALIRKFFNHKLIPNLEQERIPLVDKLNIYYVLQIPMGYRFLIQCQRFANIHVYPATGIIESFEMVEEQDFVDRALEKKQDSEDDLEDNLEDVRMSNDVPSTSGRHQQHLARHNREVTVATTVGSDYSNYSNQGIPAKQFLETHKTPFGRKRVEKFVVPIAKTQKMARNDVDFDEMRDSD